MDFSDSPKVEAVRSIARELAERGRLPRETGLCGAHGTTAR